MLIEQDGASPTYPVFASQMGASQATIFSKEVRQKLSGLNDR